MSCGSLPPVPGLIPIAALRTRRKRRVSGGGGGGGGGGASVDDSCADVQPCQRQQEHRHHRHSSHHAPQPLRNNDPARVCSVGSTGQQQQQPHQQRRRLVVEVKEEGVMGEQRPRRTGSQPSTADPIDEIARSRGRAATTSQASASGKTSRSDRHRKSERRREHKGRRLKQPHHNNKPATITPTDTKCISPRVNPIFVWVRQEDSTIVDVKCEDYDKRNRILLTKTAQGWRAIPRTETLVPNLKTADDSATSDDHTAHLQKHALSKGRKSSGKVRRRSAAVQVTDEDLNNQEEHDEDLQDNNEQHNPTASPTWSSPVNIESHLPSHTIPVLHRSHTQRAISPNINSDTDEIDSAQVATVECSVTQVSEVSPLDNLLAVAELEFNQHIQSGNWKESDSKADSIGEEDRKGMMINGLEDDFNLEEGKDDDCDYNEEDDNNIAMDDILNRLEQSLRSPDIIQLECTDSQLPYTLLSTEDLTKDEPDKALDDTQQPIDVPDSPISSIAEDEPSAEKDREPESNSYDCSEDIINSLVTIVDDAMDDKEENKTDSGHDIVESSTTSVETTLNAVDEMPTDLRVSKKEQCLTVTITDDMMPTDLTVPKGRIISRSESPRPSSPLSETIQSPQPSGLPAILPSPDPVSANSKSTHKPAYLESLLSSSTPQKSEVSTTLIQKEPLDCGKGRKSASPTITCSEEVKNNKKYLNDEPKCKKPKLDNITLKTILDASLKNDKNKQSEDQIKKVNTAPEPSRLLELLTSESDQDPLTQLHQLQADPNINLPDPLLVPKDRLSHILMSPGKEIPRLLSQRPELKLPDALTFPHLLQDPDILVITLFQLEMIIQKQGQLLSPDKIKENNDQLLKRSNQEHTIKTVEDRESVTHDRLIFNNATRNTRANSSESAKSYSSIASKEARGHKTSQMNNDMNLANNAALAQMMWLPYLQQLEMAAMAFGNNADLMKMLNNTFPPYPNQIMELPQMLATNRFPPSFPIASASNYPNPFEMPLWHDPSMLGNIRSRNQFESFCAKNNNQYRESERPGNRKSHTSSHNKQFATNKPASFPPSMFPPNNNIHFQSMQHPLINIPATYQPTNMRHNLQIPQFNPNTNQKNTVHKTEKVAASSSASSSSSHQQEKINNFMFAQERADSNRAASNHKLSYNQQLSSLASSFKHKPDFNPLNSGRRSTTTHDISKKQSADAVSQPMDLSGANIIKAKPANRHLHSESISRHVKYDDVPEVGSTTASIEEMASHMHDNQNHLWHPLFGNQKNPSNPWNWPTVTATGE